MRVRQQKSKFESSLPLIILAGLPHPIASATQNAVETSFGRSVRAVTVAASQRDASIYSESFISQLLNAAVGYAAKQARLKDPLPAPSELWLAYVPSPDDGNLFAMLDFAVFPVRLGRLAEYEEGRQLRHNLGVVKEETVSALQRVATEYVKVKGRVSNFSQLEPLLLPGRNFLLHDGSPIAKEFARLRSGLREWEDTISIGHFRAEHDDLPKHVKRGVYRTFPMDERGLVFPRDGGMHGPSREMNVDASTKERALYLRANFRFGVPLPAGFHHDAQFPRRSLAGSTFDCSRRGTLRLSCTHANIYPDDSVRALE